jgi:phosphoglycolate phosphatase-like HAD superfamily hydrolase
MNKLFLFDLDGTILKVHHQKMAEIVDKSLAISGLSFAITSEKKFAGRTDHDIFNSFIPDLSQETYHQLKETYIDLMINELKKEHVDLLHGVDVVCTWLQSSQADWGLLTGNYERTGLQKVSCSGFPLPISFGVYGDEYASRNQLAASGLDKARQHFGKEFQPHQIVIIGDTPKDIECAKVNGYISVAVSTGGYTWEELQAHQPDFTIQSLSELIEIFS